MYVYIYVPTCVRMYPYICPYIYIVLVLYSLVYLIYVLYMHSIYITFLICIPYPHLEGTSSPRTSSV